MPQQQKSTQQEEEEGVEEEVQQRQQHQHQHQRFAEQQQQFVEQQQLVHQHQQQQLLALQRQLLEAQAQIGYVPLHMQAHGGTPLPQMGALVGHYPMPQFGPYGFTGMPYNAAHGAPSAAAYNSFQFPHMFLGHHQASSGLPHYYSAANGVMPPAIAARHFPTQGQFQQQLSHPEDGSRSAERAATAPPHKNSAHRTRKRNFQRANSSSGKDRNGARAEGNFQADTEAGAQPKDDALGKGVSLSDMIRSGVIKAGENNLSLTYKGVTVRLHLSPIGSIIWPEDKVMGRHEQHFFSPTACATTIRRTIHPGAPENSGWRFIKYDGMTLADWKKYYLTQQRNAGRGSELSNNASNNERRNISKKAVRRQYRKVDGLPDPEYGGSASAPDRDGLQNVESPPSDFRTAKIDSDAGFSNVESTDSNSKKEAKCVDLAAENDPDDELTLAEAVLQWEENGRLRMERMKTENEQAKMSQEQKQLRHQHPDEGPSRNNQEPAGS